MCLGKAQEPRHRLLTLAAPRANDCISRRWSGRHKESGQRRSQRAAWEAAGALSLPAGHSPGSGLGAREAHSEMKRLPPLPVRAGARVQGQSWEALVAPLLRLRGGHAPA